MLASCRTAPTRRLLLCRSPLANAMLVSCRAAYARWPAATLPQHARHRRAAPTSCDAPSCSAALCLSRLANYRAASVCSLAAALHTSHKHPAQLTRQPLCRLRLLAGAAARYLSVLTAPPQHARRLHCLNLRASYCAASARQLAAACTPYTALPQPARQPPHYLASCRAASACSLAATLPQHARRLPRCITGH